MYEKEIEFLLSYDYKEIQKIPSQISSIDETTKAILEELKKDSPLVTEEPTEFEMRILQVLEEPQTLQAANTETLTEEPTTEEPPAEELLTEEPTAEEPLIEEPPVDEEVLSEEPSETPIDYNQLIYEELVKQNEHSVHISQQLDEIHQTGVYSNEADGMVGLYLMWIVPFFIIIYFFTVVIKPFTRF